MWICDINRKLGNYFEIRANLYEVRKRLCMKLGSDLVSFILGLEFRVIKAFKCHFSLVTLTTYPAGNVDFIPGILNLIIVIKNK